VSQENVEIVLALQPAGDTDFTRLFRDDLLWAANAVRLEEVLAPDFVCGAVGVLDAEGEVFEGVDGLRAMWLRWLGPWDSYRTEIEKALDAGDRVVVLVRDFGRPAGETNEVSITTAAVWTIQDGKVARADYYADRAEALRVAGLEE
jgi:ketosteroid isomerase-like protein